MAALLVPTDTLVSLTRIPIALIATNPELADFGWALLSYVISESLVEPVTDISNGPVEIFEELAELADKGYEPLLEQFRVRIAKIEETPPTETADIASLEMIKRLVKIELKRERRDKPIDPSWVLMVKKLQELTSSLEKQPEFEPEPEQA